MLKPSRNILRKEIKKDPLLDTFEKIEAGIENNRKNLIKILVISASVIIGGLVFLNNQRKNELESNSAFGLAMVAYSNSDYDNAKFQFESIQSNYEGTKSGILANYYLGKIAYYKDDYVLAELLLNDFIDKTKDITLVSGAIKQLFDISFQNAEYLKSSQNLEKSKNFNLGRVSMLELKLLEIKTYIKLNDFKTARIKLNEILETKNLPNYIKQNADELIGMI